MQSFSKLVDILCMPYKTVVHILSRLIQRDHFAPHPGTGFEGYYSRTQLEDGATLAIIFCWVKGATYRPNFVHVSYTPPDGGDSASFPAFRHEFFPDDLHVSIESRSDDGHQSFAIAVPGIGSMKVGSKSIEYTISAPDIQLHLDLCLTDHTPWSTAHAMTGPMGAVSHISDFLPLNWHVYSIASAASYTLSYAGHTCKGAGVTHVEKNWGLAFPQGWIWSQTFASARDGKSLCLAGGTALPGVHAYLVGYRSPRFRWDFRLPFTAAVGPFSPFTQVRHDSRAGTVELQVQTLLRRLVVRLDAPSGSFIPISAPLKDGHHFGLAHESFEARTWVEAWTRPWPYGSWTLAEEGYCGDTSDGTPSNALEFGGSFCHLVPQEGKKMN